jgi:hypothetical protein
MLVVWCSLLLQFLAAASAAAVLPECSVDGCAAAVRPVCGSDGLTYMNTCLAACQGVTIARHGSCVPQKGANDGASTAAIHIPAGMLHGESVVSHITQQPDKNILKPCKLLQQQLLQHKFGQQGRSPGSAASYPDSCPLAQPDQFKPKQPQLAL